MLPIRVGVLVMLCVGPVLFGGCAGLSEFERFVGPGPPCEASPLSDDEVRVVVGRYFAENGESAVVPVGMKSRVVPYGCVYIYEESQAFDKLTNSFEVMVDRDGRVFPLYRLPDRPD
jgi:hypothetical protein